jgi:hypothetical protein
MIAEINEDIYGNSIAYDGNPNLKRPNTKLAFTKEHIEEYMKCAKDWKYFAENYYYILDIDHGMVRPKIRDYQIEMINSYINNRFTVCLASRQTGKSTSFEIFICWTLLFQKDKNIAILANKAEQSRDILRKVKQAYEMLPKWLQQGVKVWNTGSIKLENGNLVLASSTSSTAIRGRAISILIVDERAFIPANIWDDFLSSVYPTISSGLESKVIYVSTPNGLNHFYKDWQDALDKKSKFNPIRVDWWQDPKKSSQPNWKEETIANIGLTKFQREYGNSFLGSIATLVDPDIVKNLKFREPLSTSRIHDNIPEPHHKYLNIYEEPIRGHQYSIGVDSCKMTEENAGDALGMQVLDITVYPFRQVATFFATSGFHYLFAPEVAYKLGNFYNQAFMFVENNEVGQEVANIIHFDYEYENVYFEKDNTPGYRTTKKTKRLGTTNLKLLVESGKLELVDFESISQLSTFIRVKDSYKAESGYKDDLTMALISSLFFMISKGLDINDTNDTQKMIATLKNESVLDEEMDVPGFGVLPSDDYGDEKRPDEDGFTW